MIGPGWDAAMDIKVYSLDEIPSLTLTLKIHILSIDGRVWHLQHCVAHTSTHFWIDMMNDVTMYRLPSKMLKKKTICFRTKMAITCFSLKHQVCSNIRNHLRRDTWVWVVAKSNLCWISDTFLIQCWLMFVGVWVLTGCEQCRLHPT